LLLQRVDGALKVLILPRRILSGHDAIVVSRRRLRPDGSREKISACD
jgi:hypothetical protein